MVRVSLALIFGGADESNGQVARNFAGRLVEDLLLAASR